MTGQHRQPMIPIDDLQPDEHNPRYISSTRMEALKQSIQEFEKMMSIRPIVVDEHNVILGGTMRHQALKQLGYKELPDDWVVQRTDLTEEEKRQFRIKDNVAFGDWDWDLLANDWEPADLNSWGLHVWQPPDETDTFDPNYDPKIDPHHVNPEDTVGLKHQVARNGTDGNLTALCPKCFHEFTVQT